MATITDPYELSADASKIELYNKRTIDNGLKVYKNNFNRVQIWVTLREQIVKLIKKETSKNTPGTFLSANDGSTFICKILIFYET